MKPRPNQAIRLLKSLKKEFGYQKIVGIDEVGRGAIAGPLVVAAVELTDNIADIKDSKQLSKKSRELIADQIHKSALQISFGIVSAKDVDLYGMKKSLTLAYIQALNGIIADMVLTDNYNLPTDHKYIKTIKGDDLFYVTSAASIIAKVFRDQLMNVYHQIYPQYNWLNNSGYGTGEHFLSIDKYGTTMLHRTSFIKKGVTRWRKQPN